MSRPSKFLRTGARRRGASLPGLIATVALFAIGLSAQTGGVRTHHNDHARTGVNSRETWLTRDRVRQSVTANRFGKLATLPVRGQVYAQPLYLPDVPSSTGNRDLVLVATMHNNVYAFNGQNFSRIWARNFGCHVPYDAKPLWWADVGYNIHDAVGIQGTPVVDDRSRYLYFVTKVDRNAAGQNSDPDSANCVSGPAIDIHFELHKVDVLTGLDAAAPKPIDVSLSPKATLNPALHLQRAGLLLANGSVYVAFSGYQDTPRWHGWVMRFDASDLSSMATFCVTPTGSGGGIWQAGSGLAADAQGHVYFMSGNGTTKPNETPPNLGTAFVELSASLDVAHYFIPANHLWLNIFDLDLGSSGPVLLADGGLIGGGKEGRLYGLGPPSSPGQRPFALHHSVQVTQRFGWPFLPPFSARHIHGTPVVWEQTVNDAWVYVWGEGDHLKRYTYKHTRGSGRFTEKKVSALSATRMGMPGGTMSLAVDGTNHGSGILWASLPLMDAFIKDVHGILRAVDPDTLEELWNNSSEHYLYAKYCPPTVAGGKVFLATFSDRVDVYGILP